MNRSYLGWLPVSLLSAIMGVQVQARAQMPLTDQGVSQSQSQSQQTHASQGDPLNLADVCSSEMTRFCPGIKDNNRTDAFKCLVEHKADASPSCVDRLNQAPAADLPKIPRKSSPGFAVLGALGLMPTSTSSIVYGGTEEPAANSGVSQRKLTLQVPVYQESGSNFSLSLGANSLHFGEYENLSGSGIQVPDQFWKIELGASYSKKLEDDKFEGIRFSLGSASERPFDGIGVTTVGASAFYSWTKSERSRWMVTLFVSNNNPLINYVPVPGFIYLYQSPTFIGMFGFPFTSVIWMPVQPWVFSFSAFGPTIIAEAAYGSPKIFQVFTGYSWLQQSYLRVDRSDPKDRIYYSEMHLPLGVRFPIGSLRTELSGGYAFDRSVYEGTSLFKKEDGSFNFGNSWYASWNLGIDL